MLLPMSPGDVYAVEHPVPRKRGAVATDGTSMAAGRRLDGNEESRESSANSAEGEEDVELQLALALSLESPGRDEASAPRSVEELRLKRLARFS